jgi:hypothetical protein
LIDDQINDGAWIQSKRGLVIKRKRIRSLLRAEYIDYLLATALPQGGFEQVINSNDFVPNSEHAL